MKSYKSLKKRLNRISASIALFLILFSGIIISFHHHEDGKIKDECPICRLQQYENNAVSITAISESVPLQFYIKPVINPDESPVKPVIFSSAHSHAPPVFS